jgi:carboxyl-terminal processing protease
MKIIKTKFNLWVVAIIATTFVLMSTDRDRFTKIAKSMEIFNDAYRKVNDAYVDETDPNLLMRTAIDSMNAKLDPYTNYFSEAQMERLRINYKGFWDGVGVEIMEHEGKILVKDVVEESAAAKAEIRIGDQLLSIDGADIKDRKVEDIEQSLHGKAGTEVSIKLKKVGTDEEKLLTLKRSKVVRKNVPYYDMVDENTAYIVLTTFTERAGANVGDALKELQEDHEVKQVILDLRDNGGGLLIEAVNLCNIFLPKGEEIVATRNKVADWDRPFPTLNNPVDTKVPLIILMNDHSASASEIVAGAIQDFDRGILLGRRSFGKGLVQNTYDIGYNSKVKLTTARYYIPSGRCIQALEYKDGKSQQIADSLRKPFFTKNKRPVYDGGGLRPDYKVEQKAESAIAKGLKESKLIFEYANIYRAKHDSIAAAVDFKLSDADFKDFVAFVKKRNYTYKTESEEALERMEKEAKKEGSYTQLKANFEKMRKSMEAAKKEDIYKYQEEITRLLEEEIINRYYFEKGVIQARLTRDADVQEAIKLFAKKEEFKKLLTPPAPQKD